MIVIYLLLITRQIENGFTRSLQQSEEARAADTMYRDMFVLMRSMNYV